MDGKSTRRNIIITPLLAVGSAVGFAGSALAQPASMRNQLVAATSTDQLWVRDPVLSDVGWRLVGHAQLVTGLTALNGLLWATTSTDQLWVRDPVLSEVNWRLVGHAQNVRAMTAVP
jgi:hypothetical protein